MIESRRQWCASLSDGRRAEMTYPLEPWRPDDARYRRFQRLWGRLYVGRVPVPPESHLDDWIARLERELAETKSAGPVRVSYLPCPNCGEAHDRRRACARGAAA